MQAAQQQQHQPDKASMEIYVVIAFALIAIVGGVIFYNGSITSEPPEITTPPPIPERTPVIAPKPQTIVTDAPIETPVVAPTAPIITEAPIVDDVVKVTLPPLPSLDDSDNLTMKKASQLSWLPNYTAMLIPSDMLRNFVTFIDNLSRGDLANKFTPLERPKQKFSARDSGESLYLDEASYKRYSPYIDVINSLNIELAMAHYQQLMPLIDEAYMELGYESGAFNQVLINAIDMMLAAPIIREPIELIAPSAMYQFKNQTLEQLPAAQKLMLRIGPNNATQLRPKLQQIQISLSQFTNREG